MPDRIVPEERDAVRKLLVETFVEVLDVDANEVRDEAHIVNDLGSDSLGLVELVLAVEEAFEIDIPDEDAEEVHTFGQAVEYVVKRVQGD